jgi:WD40 repeat protein
MQVLTGHTADVLSLSFSPDGRQLASASWDGTVRIWDLRTGACSEHHATGRDYAFGVAHDESGLNLAAVFRDNVPRGYPFITSDLAWIRANHSAWGPDEGTPYWPIGASPTQSRPLAQASSRVQSVTVAPGPLVIAGFGNGDVEVWDPNERQLQRRLQVKNCSIPCVAADAKGQRIAAATSLKGNGVLVWECQRRWRATRLVGDRAEACGGSSVAFSASGEELFASIREAIFQWNLETDERRLIGWHDHDIRGLAVNPNGLSLLTSSIEGLVKLWDLATDTERAVFDWQLGDVHSLAISPDGLVAAAGGSRDILLWDIDI